MIQRYAKTFDLPASSILSFLENLGRPGAHKDARRFVASKILALMRFLEARSTEDGRPIAKSRRSAFMGYCRHCNFRRPQSKD